MSLIIAWFRALWLSWWAKFYERIAGTTVVIEAPKLVRFCETCDVTVTWENARQHPNGLGGHVVTEWEAVHA